MNSVGLDRRRFMQLASAGTIGCCLATYRPTQAEAVSFAGLVSMVGRFAVSVGSSVVANSINSYLSNRSTDRQTRDRVIEANQSLGREGFSDLSRSTVYQAVVHEDLQRLYYPLVYNDQCGCQHFVAPFFNVACGCRPITHIQGPHMAGLTLAAELLRQHGWPQSSTRRGDESIRSVLVPKEEIRRAHGDKSRGYTQPLIYRSDNALVAIDYQPSSEHSGTVQVEAQRVGGKSILREWDIRFA